MQTSLLTLNTVKRGETSIQPVQSSTKSGTVNRLVTKKEFRAACPELAGNALSTAFNNYIRAGAPSAIGEIVRRVTAGEMAPVSERDSKNACTIRFVKLVKPEITADMIDALPVNELAALMERVNARLKQNPALPAPKTEDKK